MLMKEERVHRDRKQGQVKMKVRGDESYAARSQEVPQLPAAEEAKKDSPPKPRGSTALLTP